MRSSRGLFARATFVLTVVSLAAVASAAAPAPVPAPAPPTPAAGTGAADVAARTLGLRDVLARAATDNPDLRRERVAIDLATANVLIAEGQFDLTLTGDGTFSRRRNPVTPSSNSTISQSASVTETFVANVALTRALESGGRVALSAQELATKTSQGQTCTLGTSGQVCGTQTGGLIHNGNLNLTFTHPLLRGFGAEVTLANLRKQRILRDTGLLNRQARAAVVVRDVVINYWELGYAADDLAIRRSAVKLAEEQRRYTQAQVDVGRLGLADLAAVDRAIADRQQDVAVAEQTMLLRSLDLERLIGRQVPANFVPSVAAERPSPTPLAIEQSAETAHALTSSPQLRALRAGVELSTIDLRTAQALVRPQLDFIGSIGTTGRQFALGDTWAQAGRFENINWTAGLQFQLPLQNRAARGAEQAARASEERVHIDVEDLELSIRDGVVRLAGAARTAVRRGELARAAVGYAAKNLEAERARFDVGRSTNNDVLLRQQELKAAEIQVARAAADLANAETALAALTGDILERYGVVLRGS